MSKARQDRPRAHGRGSALTAFGLGVIVSVGANVAHLWYPSPATLARVGVTAGHWRPAPGAMVMSAFYPLALTLTVEILARVQWPRATSWAAMRFAGAGAVALVAAIVSYGHMSGLLRAYGEDRLTATIGPLAVDGMLVVAGFALLAIGRASSLASEVPATAPIPVEVPVVPVPEPVEVPALAAVEAREPNAEHVPADAPADLEPHLVKAASLFAPEIVAGTVPGIREIKDALNVGQRKAQEAKMYLESLVPSTA